MAAHQRVASQLNPDGKPPYPGRLVLAYPGG